MTTIAYRDGLMAADTLMTSNSVFETHVNKVWRHKGFLGASAGSAALCERFRSWFLGGMDGPCPWEGTEEGNGIVATPEHRLILWGKFGPWTVDRPFYALGSGEQFATGAMLAGASAEEAVRIASTVDRGTGGKITVMSHAQR